MKMKYGGASPYKKRKNQEISIFPSLDEFKLLSKIITKESKLNKLYSEIEFHIERNLQSAALMSIPLQEALSLIKILIQANNNKLKNLLYDIMEKSLTLKK